MRPVSHDMHDAHRKEKADTALDAACGKNRIFLLPASLRLRPLLPLLVLVQIEVFGLLGKQPRRLVG